MLVFCLCMLTGTRTFAYQYVNGIYYNFNNTDMTATVTYGYSISGTYTYKNVEIPSTVTYNEITYNVTTIGEDAFRNCKNVESITIPTSISEIEKDAFYNCTGLQKVIIHDVAAWCRVTFNNNPLFYAKHLYSDENTEIKDLIIPNGVTSISDAAFEYCEGLTSVEISNSVTTIGKYAFRDCSGLTSITIPNSVTGISWAAFYNCDNLQKVIITDISAWCDIEFEDETANPLYYAKHIFSDADTELAYLNIPSETVKIGSYSFYNCSGLSKITISDGVKTIGKNAFSGCIGLKEINIPESIENIDDYAFSECNGLDSLYIPNCQLGSLVLYGCYLNKLRLNLPTIETAFNAKIGFGLNGKGHVRKIEFGDSVTNIEEDAFDYDHFICNVSIPNSVKSIGYHAFSGCYNLDTLHINKSIIDYNFCEQTGLKHLKYVSFGDSVKSIELSAFSGEYTLETVSFSKSPITIKAYGFGGCSNLNKVIVPNISAWCNSYFVYYYQQGGGSNPLEIAHHLYSDENTEIKDLIIPDGVENINAHAFYGCNNLASISIPNSVKNIESNAFVGCSGLQKVMTKDANTWCRIIFGNANSNPVTFTHHLYDEEGTEITNVSIPSDITSLSGYTFYGCEGLTTIKIPESITKIGEDAFTGCIKLEKVVTNSTASWCNIEFGNLGANPLNLTHRLYDMENMEIVSLDIPSTVKSINNFAFYGWSSLKSLVIPNGLQSIGMNAFSNCSSLEKIVIPNTVTSIGKEAFSDCMSLYSVTSLINMPFKLDESAFRYTGNDYNEDIVYMAATLYVPRGRTAMYNNVEGWKKFMNITETDTKFKLTYMLDGEKYKEYEIQATEVITPESDPYKEHYIFSGWSEIPYLMPAQDVTITGSFTIDPEYEAGVEGVAKEDAKPTIYYSVDGRKQKAQHRGLNIIRMSDGTVKKVMVK